MRPTGGDADAEILVPFVSAIVPEVDVTAGRLIVTPPAGLFEELPGDEAGEAAPDAVESADAENPAEPTED